MHCISKKLSITILILVLLAGCSTKNISQLPSTDIKLVSNNINVNVQGVNISQDIMNTLIREIKGQLIINGFDLCNEATSCINLNVQISEFKPGNAALRATVGFGAGRGSLVYTAEYIGSEGTSLARMDGQERFTGMEVSYNSNYGAMTTLGGEETATKVLTKEAAKHIVELSTNNPT